MPQAKILPSYELYSEEQKAVIARIGPQFRDAADRHTRAHLRREAGVEVAALCPADSTYSIPAWSESACNYMQNHFKPPPSGPPPAKKVIHRQRARKWTDMWADEHADQLQQYLKTKGTGDGLKARNLAIKELTESVADDERARYRQAARDHKAGDMLTAEQQMKNRKDLLRYARSVATGLNSNYGVPFALLLTGYKDEDGEWSITVLDNNDVVDPRVSTMKRAMDREFNTIVTLWQKYVQKTTDALEDDTDPPAAGPTGAVRISRGTGRELRLLPLDNAGHCIIPSDSDINLLSAKDLSRALREVCTAEYVLATGIPSATVPWVDIRAQPESYFDVEHMWLEGVQVEDPSHLRRRFLVTLLKQYRSRDDRFIRFTGVQRNGDMVSTGLYPPMEAEGVADDVGIDDQEQPTSTVGSGRGSARRKQPEQKHKDKGKRRARQESSEEPEAVFTDEDEAGSTALTTPVDKGLPGTSAKTAPAPRPRVRPRPTTKSAPPMRPVIPMDGLLTLSDYAEQPPDEFRDMRDRHVSYVKALAPGDTRLQAAADHVFGLRGSTLEDIGYPSLPMLPWANWYYDSLTLPSPSTFDYTAMWTWLANRQFITGDMFQNRSGQLEQLTLGVAMLLREVNSATFDRASPSDDVIERESVLAADMTISSATDVVHGVLDLILSITPPPSNHPLGGPTHSPLTATRVPATANHPSEVAPDSDTMVDAGIADIPVAHSSVTTVAVSRCVTDTFEGDLQTEHVTVVAADVEDSATEEADGSEAALRKRKRAATGPSSMDGQPASTSGELAKSGGKPPSKISKGHQFAEQKTRSGRQTTVSERARGAVVL
ncbi:hypothetical protein BDW22DRAFT_1352071, partial [Trametopsis cervina]